MSSIEQRVEQLVGSLDDNTVIARIGVPPSTQKLKERLNLILHPSTYQYKETPVTFALFKQVLERKEQGEKLSPQDEEILRIGTLALSLAAVNSTNHV